MGEARGEACDAQHPQRILDEGIGDMAQNARLEVALSAIGVDDQTILVLGHGIDGEIAARQILLDGDRRIGVEGETAVAPGHLALGARQRVFLVGVRVQKDREILAHGLVALFGHLLRRGAGDDPVHILNRAAEQPVAHRAADAPDLHRRLR